MDTEERHELKENDLAEMLRNFGDWFNEHGTKVLVVLILVAGTFAGYNFYSTSVEQRYEAAWADLASAATPEDYLGVARAHDEPTVQTLAYLRGADLYRRRAIDRFEPMEEGDEPGLEAENSPADASENEAPPAEADLEQAAAMYQRVLETNAEPAAALYRINALIGLGAVAESRKAWDEAQAHYEQAVELAGEQMPTLARQAEQRLDLLEDLRRPIVFAPDSEAGAPPPSMGPMMPGMPGAPDMPEAPATLPEGVGDDVGEAFDEPVNGLDIEVPDDLGAPPAEDEDGAAEDAGTEAPLELDPEAVEPD